MENKIICQSCGMPIDTDSMKGTEKNGSKSNQYCKYCYENGAFKHPNIILEDMQKNVKNQMKKLELHDQAIQKAINLLPELKRWKS